MLFYIQWPTFLISHCSLCFFLFLAPWHFVLSLVSSISLGLVHSGACLWNCLRNCLRVPVQFSCIAEERVSDLYNEICVSRCVLDCLPESSIFRMAINAGRKEETSPTLPRHKYRSSWGKDKHFCQAPEALCSPHTGLIWSPGKAMAGRTVGEVLLQLKDVALTRPLKHSTYWAVQRLSLHSLLSSKVFLTALKRLSYNCVFLISTFFSVSCYISCLKMATKPLGLPKALNETSIWCCIFL